MHFRLFVDGNVPQIQDKISLSREWTLQETNVLVGIHFMTTIVHNNMFAILIFKRICIIR